MKGDCQAYQQQLDHFIALKDVDGALNCLHDGLEQSGYDLNHIKVARDACRFLNQDAVLLKILEDFNRCQPSLWQSYSFLSEEVAREGDLHRALVVVYEGLDACPNQLRLLARAAKLYRDLGTEQKSLLFYQRMIEHHPDQWQGYAGAAESYVGLAELQCCEDVLTRGLQCLPHHPNLIISAIKIYRGLGRLQSSIELCRSLISVLPENHRGYAWAAEDCATVERPKQALVFVLQGLAAIPASVPLLRLGIKISRNLGDYRQSMQFVQLLRAAEVDQNQVDRWLVQDQLSLGLLQPSHVSACLKDIAHPRGQDETFQHSIHGYRDNDLIHDLWRRSFRLLETTSEKTASPDLNFQAFQYWSQGEPPLEIQRVTQVWNDLLIRLGLSPIELFDHQRAHHWIEQHCPCLLPAFQTAFHYACEADIFRVAYALSNNCIWLDSDLYPTVHTEQILQESISGSPSTTLLFAWFKPYLTNAFFVTSKHSPFFKRIVDEMSNFTFEGKDQNGHLIWTSFGPGRYQATLKAWIDRDDVALAQSGGLLWSGLTCQSQPWTLQFLNTYRGVEMTPPFDLAYKQTNDAWQLAFANPQAVV